MRLINEEGKAIGCKEVGSRSISALSKSRVRILSELSKGPGYPSEIARELGIPLQTAYYHIHILEKAGLVEFMDYTERGGGVAKRFICKAESFAVILKNDAWRPSMAPGREVPPIIKPFVRDGLFKGMMVVGSPDPHGRYRARASELGMLEFAMFLGQYASFDLPLYILDTQLKAEHRKMDLILAGGPKVNTAVEEINSALPLRFSRDNSEIISKTSGKGYMGNIGVVELVRSPYAQNAHMLVISGLNQNGTRAAVISLVRDHSRLSQGAQRDESIAHVVEGFDEDGDGIVDAIEFLE